MMGFHCIDYNWMFLVLLAQVHSKFYVGTFHFVVDSFSNVMEQPSAFCHPDIDSDLRCQQP